MLSLVAFWIEMNKCRKWERLTGLIYRSHVDERSIRPQAKPSKHFRFLQFQLSIHAQFTNGEKRVKEGELL